MFFIGGQTADPIRNKLGTQIQIEPLTVWDKSR